MKHKNIYKILTVAVMVSLILSLVAVNASAFYRVEGGFSALPGDTDDGTVRYNEYYIAVNCGQLGTLYDASPGSYDLTSFVPLTDLKHVLSGLNNGCLLSPNGEFDYDGRSYEVVQFYVNRTSGGQKALSPIGAFDMGNNNALFYSCGLRVFESCVDEEISYSIAPGIFNSYSRNDELIAIVYLDHAAENGLSPYFYFEQLYDHHMGDINELNQELEICYQDLEALEANLLQSEEYVAILSQRITSLEAELASLAKEKDDLTAAYITEVSRLSSEINELQRDLDYVLEERAALYDEKVELQTEIFNLNKLIFETENNDTIGLLFTGITDSIVTSIQQLSGLGFDYNQDNVKDFTIGNLLTLAVLAAFLAFILRWIFGGKR